jgi:hypothetical protein
VNPPDKKPRTGSAKPKGESSSASPSTEKRDVVLVHGVTPDGKGFEVLRARDERVEQGTVRPLDPGKPIYGEVVKLTPRTDAPLVYDVDVQLEKAQVATDTASSTVDTARSGPAQVASDSYRRNWDAIWKRRKRVLPS